MTMNQLHHHLWHKISIHATRWYRGYRSGGPENRIRVLLRQTLGFYPGNACTESLYRWSGMWVQNLKTTILTKLFTMDSSNNESADVKPTVSMNFSPPVITTQMMPRPDPSIEKQALATLPSLLNRNKSEHSLSTRILTECSTVQEALNMIIKTIGDLE